MTETILIVDDSTFIVEGLVALLKKTYQPIPSYGGEECLEILRKVTPSLIILDIMMEPMDGWETLSRIKNNPKTRHIPVLMFSAKKISPEEAEAHRIIIDDFLTKPVNPKKLLEAIEKILSRQASNRRIISTWNAAGVNPEIIDEYLTLKTNLDVDVSFLAVMRKQLDMAFPDAGNREDLKRSITALEERIENTRARIDVFCREKAPLLPPQGADAQHHLPEPGPEPDSAGSPLAPVPENVQAPHEQNIPPAVAPVQEEPVPAPPAMERDPDPVPPAGEPETVRVPETAPAPEAEPLPPPISEKPVLLVPPPGPKPVFMQPRKTGLTVPEAGPDMQDPVRDVSVTAPYTTPDTEPAKDHADLFEPFTKTPEPSSPVQASRPAGVMETGPAPRMTSHSISGGGFSASPGAGTQTPAMHTRGISPPRGQERDPDDETGSQTTTPPAEKGFIARILSAIAGIFRRQKS